MIDQPRRTDSAPVPRGSWWWQGVQMYWFTSAFGAGWFRPRYDFPRFVERGLGTHISSTLRETARILDVGTGYSILPLWLARLRKYEVYIVDSEVYLSNVVRFHESEIRKLPQTGSGRKAARAFRDGRGPGLRYRNFKIDGNLAIGVTSDGVAEAHA